MRYDQMSAFIVMDIVREAAKYPNAIHFEIGQPDLPPSDNVKAALKDIFTIEFKPQGAFYLFASHCLMRFTPSCKCSMLRV